MLSARLVSLLAVLAASVAAAGDARAAAPGQTYMARTYMTELPVAGAAPVHLHVEEWGSGPPILLLHGLGMSSFTWRQIAPKLAETHRVIAVDLKGFGRSDKPSDTAYSARDQAELIAAFIEQKQLDQLTLVGHSFGGVVALLTALELKDRGPSRVARLVIIDSPALPQKFSGATLASAPLLPDAFLAATPPELLIRGALKLSRHRRNPPPEEDIKEYAAALSETGGRHALVATMQGIVANETKAWVDAYRGLDQPALLIWCRNDDIVPIATGRKLARILPHASLTVLTTCNHIPQNERPAAVLSALRQFLAN
jgi:pimeloyl-ACP methyl ester carboxylesterase